MNTRLPDYGPAGVVQSRRSKLPSLTLFKSLKCHFSAHHSSHHHEHPAH